METYCQVNLRLPATTKARLDAACRRSAQSVSSVLRTLVEGYVAQAAEDLAAHKRRMAVLDEEIARHPRLLSFKEFIARREQAGGDEEC